MRNTSGRLFDLFNYCFIGLIALLTLYPFWDVMVSSIIPLKQYVENKVHLFPTALDLTSYRIIFGMQELWSSYGVTLFRTVVGTSLNMLLTMTCGYVLSKNIRGQRLIMFLIAFTLLFQGGMIPLYMVVRMVGVMNTVWALILPSAMLTWNLIIMKNFFITIPESLEESARLDGCNDLTILFRIVAPISMPAIATLSLFYAVYHWNDFFSAVLYITDKAKWPLQLFLRAMLFQSEASTHGGGDDPYLLASTIKMATIMIATVPIICVYPFFQRYFVKGVTLGAIKE